MRTYVSSKWFAICRVLLFYISSVIIFATIAGITKNLFLADYLSILVTSILTFFLVVLFARWEKLPLKDIGLIADNGSLLRFLSGLGIGIIMVLIQMIIVINFAEVKFSLAQHNQPATIITSLILYFLLACREELAFRSYSLRSLAYSLRPSVALAIITIIFVIEHVIGGMSWKMSILGAGLGGILFGLAALKTKGLALPLGLHFSWNFTQWLLGFKNNTGVWREIVEKGHESQADNIAVVGFSFAMSISIVGILLFYRKKKNEVVAINS